MDSGPSRRRFTRAFKLRAVQLTRKPGMSVRSAATELNVPENTLYRWVREFDRYGDDAFPGNGRSRAAADELTRLRRENARLALEIEILRKAAAWMKKQKT